MSNSASSIPQWLNESYMEAIVQNSIDKNAKIVSLEVTSGSNIGDNYMCRILRIKLIINGTNRENEEMYLIGKFNADTAMDQEICRENYSVHGVESKFLLEILPNLNKHALGRKIGPKTFHVDNNKRIIFMEDLKQQGFVLVPRESFLDVYHCFKTVQAHATLHAASYLELQKNPDLKNLRNTIWRKDLPEFMKKIVRNGIKGIEDKQDQWNFAPKHREIFEKYKKRVLSDGFFLFEYNPKCFNVLTHGDVWKNNMMFRYENKVVKEVCLLDFQVVAYNSFALDLQYFLSSSAQRDVRYTQIDIILEFYYNEFCKISPNVPELSLQRVKEEFAEKNFIGLVFAMLMRPLVVSSGGLDIDSIIEGKSDTGAFENAELAQDVKKALEYFENSI